MELVGSLHLGAVERVLQRHRCLLVEQGRGATSLAGGAALLGRGAGSAEDGHRSTTTP
ncbi:hypothetical protein [Ornithinimicrobium kibberense]|uniref:hypothetical protein n=1 Tax=Ornithinimicrobium kibberense TaxID=282060 RepID=UPI00361C7927